MTKYLSDKICAEPEKLIATYCADNNLEFTDVTATKIVMAACKDKPIIKISYDCNNEPIKNNITADVAWEYSGCKAAIERVQNKIAALKQIRQEKIYKANIEADKIASKPDLDKLVDALYNFNIVDKQSYLAVVYFLMQLKATRNQKMPKRRKSQRIALFLSGVQGNGKSTFADCVLEIEQNFGSINSVNGAESFDSRFEENLWKAHLNICDEVVPSKIPTTRLIRAVDGAPFQLERKNQTPYTWYVNTNLIFTSNDSVSLKQRRVAVVKFGDPIQNTVPFESLVDWMKQAMDSLPDFNQHGEMYKIIGRANQKRLNPQGIESISKFLGLRFDGHGPDDNKTIKFNTTQIFDMIKDKPSMEFLKSDRKEAIRDALEYMVKKGYIDEFKYKGCTTKQYEINTAQYYEFRKWADSINTLDEINVRTTKAELRELLAPYFKPTLPDDYVPLTKIKLPEVIITPPPAKLLALPSPEYFNKNSGEADIKNGNAANMKSDETAEIKNSATSTIKELSIDLETYSDVDIKQNGVYKYADNPNFDILLFAYSVNGGDVKVVDLASGEKIPEDVLKALTDDTVIKWAFNANFERVCLSVWLQKYYPQYFKGYQSDEKALQNYLSPTSWRCSMVWSNYVGLPHSLDAVGKELNLTDQKMKEGKELIKYFCCPCKPIVKNGMRTRNLPQHNPDGWETFKQYNKRDVEAELEIKERLRLTPVPEDVWKQYAIDQKINDRGVKIDTAFVQKAQEVDDTIRDVNYSELKNITGIDNPNSTVQLKNWLKTQGVIADNLDKKAIEKLLTQHTGGIVSQALKLKLQLAKSSVKKYSRMQDMVTQDGRARGCFMFYGATTTGRWAGRGIQLQNLPQNHLAELDAARNAILNADYTAMREKFVSDDCKTSYNTSDALSQLLRTAIIPEDGHKFIVADYSQIEARVLSVIAGEEWRLKAFASNKDIYCESASHMFNKPVVKNGINGELRV